MHSQKDQGQLASCSSLLLWLVSCFCRPSHQPTNFGETICNLQVDVWRFSCPNGQDPKHLQPQGYLPLTRPTSLLLTSYLQLAESPAMKKSEDPSDTDRHLDFGGNKLAEPSGNLSSLAFVWTRAVTVCLYCRCVPTSRHPTLRDWTCLSVLGKWYYRMVSIVASTSMKGREVPVQLRYPTMSGSFDLGAAGACTRIYDGNFQVHVGHTKNHLDISW